MNGIGDQVSQVKPQNVACDTYFPCAFSFVKCCITWPGYGFESPAVNEIGGLTRLVPTLSLMFSCSLWESRLTDGARSGVLEELTGLGKCFALFCLGKGQAGYSPELDLFGGSLVQLFKTHFPFLAFIRIFKYLLSGWEVQCPSPAPPPFF